MGIVCMTQIEYVISTTSILTAMLFLCTCYIVTYVPPGYRLIMREAVAERTKNQVLTGFMSDLTSPIYSACLLSREGFLVVSFLDSPLAARKMETFVGECIHNYACAKGGTRI